MTDFSKTFKDLITQIDIHGDVSKPRDLEVKELLLNRVDIDPTKPIANFEARAFNWKYFAGEMAWYLHRDTDVDYIGQYSGMWSTLTNPGTNEINSNYGALVLNTEQIGWVVDSLLADNNSRQAIMFFNQPKFQFKGNKDFVCTMYANFFIKHNKYKDLELGTYHHFADNIHFYERHFELAKKIKSEDDALESNINTLILKKPLVDYNGKDVFVTDEGMEFTRRLDQTQGSKEVNYKNILKDYFTL